MHRVLQRIRGNNGLIGAACRTLCAAAGFPWRAQRHRLETGVWYAKPAEGRLAAVSRRRCPRLRMAGQRQHPTAAAKNIRPSTAVRSQTRTYTRPPSVGAAPGCAWPVNGNIPPPQWRSLVRPSTPVRSQTRTYMRPPSVGAAPGCAWPAVDIAQQWRRLLVNHRRAVADTHLRTTAPAAQRRVWCGGPKSVASTNPLLCPINSIACRR